MQLMQSHRGRWGSHRCLRKQPAHQRTIAAYRPCSVLQRPGNNRYVAAQGFQAPYGGGGGYPGGVRTAIAQQLAQASSLQDVQDIINRYSDYLSPAEILQLASAAPRMVRGPLGNGRLSPGPFSPGPQLQPQPPPFLGLSPAAAAAAAAGERQRRADAQQQQQQRQYQDMMNQLARGFRRVLPDAAGSELADTAYALAHAGALDEGLATELLQHTIKQAAAGKLGVQGLADVLTALSTARYRPGPATVQQLVRDVDPVNKCKSPQELSALLEGLSRLGYNPDESFADRVLARMAERQAEQQRQAAQAKQQQQQQQQKRGFPSFGWGKSASSSSQAPQEQKDNGEETDDEQAERERQEAQHVSAAIRSLQRMGHVRQAEQLKNTYLQDLQKREAARMRARQQRASQRAAEEEARLEKQRLEQQLREQQRFEQLRAEQQRAEQQARLERERVAAQERAAQLRAEQERAAQRERETAERERAQRQRAEKDRSTVQAAVKDAVTRARTWQQLLTLMYSLPPEYLGAPQLCEIVSALPESLATAAASLSWRERAQLSNMLETWGGLMTDCLQEQQQQLTAAQLMPCLQALVSLRWMNEQVWGLLLREARRLLPASEPQQLLSLVQVLSEAGLKPSGPWMDAYFSESARKLPGLSSPAELRELAACLLKLGVRPPPDWLLAYLGALQSQEAQMSLEEAAACMRVAAQWDAGLVQRWYQGLMNRKKAEQLQQQQRSIRPAGPAGILNRFNNRPVAATVVDTLNPTPSSSTASTRSPNSVNNQKAGSATGKDSAASAKPTVAGSGAVEADVLDPPDSLYNRLIPDASSIDFDEEMGAAADKQQLPDTFLLHHMGMPAKARPQPLSRAQARALRSVVLERLELAESRAADSEQAVEAARRRQENAAVQLAAVRSQLAVLQGDYDRVKARHHEEKSAVSQQVGSDVMSRLLPLLDNFERAAMSLKARTPGEQAVMDAYQQLPAAIQEQLSSVGIKEVPGVGQPFDPAVHDAIMQEFDPSVPEGTVLAVLQKGYQSGERLLRPALVKVSAA